MSDRYFEHCERVYFLAYYTCIVATFMIAVTRQADTHKQIKQKKHNNKVVDVRAINV